MHEEQTLALNSHFYNDFESKWNNQFDLASSNSLNLTRSAKQGGGGLFGTGGGAPAKQTVHHNTMSKGAAAGGELAHGKQMSGSGT